MIELEPERITELRALLAARLAMVAALVCLPPVTELMILWLTAVTTEDAATVAAFWTVLRRCSASFSAALAAAASSFWRCFSAAAAAFSAQRGRH